MSQSKTHNLLLILILPIITILSFTISHRVFADNPSSNQTKFWSLEETKTIFEDFKNQLTIACGDDRVCRLNFLNELKQQDSKYGVVSYFANSAFMITSVNPDKNTIKAYYNSFDYRTWERRGEEVHRDLTELYICWLDPDFEVWQFSANLRRGNEMPGLHPITRISASINDGKGLPFPANEEVEIIVPEVANLAGNSKQNLYFSAWTGIGSNYTSNSDYSTCTNSPDYTPGTECKIMFGEDGSITYIPQEKHWEDPQEKPIHYQTTTEHDVIEGNNQTISTSSTNKTATLNEVKTIPFAPDTGVEALESENSREEPILSWWFIVLFIVGSAILFHFFGSKPKNPIDKDRCMR